MKYSAKLSDAVHIMCYIALNPNNDLSSTAIAQSIYTNPSCVRQIMGKLKNAGLMTSVHGHARPQLTKNPKDISLFDIYRAVEGEKPLLHLDTHINPQCNVGVNIQYALGECYDRVQLAAEREMKKITLNSVLSKYRAALKGISEQEEL